MLQTGNRNFIIGMALTIVTALYLIIDSCIIGRDAFFLLLNTDLGKPADLFFAVWTNLGDGVIWIGVAIVFFIYRKQKFPLLIAAILISTLITQVTKNYIVTAEPRPTAAIADKASIHTVPGVVLHTAYSFPSGHTATAFSIFLIACLLMRNTWIVLPGFACALLVGYSRVYLAQHFPLDVGGGMLTAVITVPLSVLIQKRFEKKNAPDLS